MHGSSLTRNNALLNENVHQALKRLHVLLGKKIVVHSDRHEMHKAAVQLQVAIDVPERVVPVAVVKMSIAAEHLLDDALDVLMKVRRKVGWFTNPILGPTSESVHRVVQVGRWGGNRHLSGPGSTGDLVVNRRESGGLNVLGCLGGEDMGIMDFADYPSLHTDDVGRSRDLSRPTVFEPGVGEPTGSVEIADKVTAKLTFQQTL